MKYIFTDYETKPSKVIFECEAVDILEADEKLLAATGKIASKSPQVTTWSPDWGKSKSVSE